MGLLRTAGSKTAETWGAMGKSDRFRWELESEASGAKATHGASLKKSQKRGTACDMGLKLATTRPDAWATRGP